MNNGQNKRRNGAPTGHKQMFKQESSAEQRRNKQKSHLCVVFVLIFCPCYTPILLPTIPH